MRKKEGPNRRAGELLGQLRVSEGPLVDDASVSQGARDASAAQHQPGDARQLPRAVDGLHSPLNIGTTVGGANANAYSSPVPVSSPGEGGELRKGLVPQHRTRPDTVSPQAVSRCAMHEEFHAQIAALLDTLKRLDATESLPSRLVYVPAVRWR